MSNETRFGIEFVVTRNGEPIIDVIQIEGAPIGLHTKHDPAVVWGFQSRVLAGLVKDQLNQLDAQTGVVPDARPVGLAPKTHHPVVERVGVAVLKPVNRALAWLLRRPNGV